MSALASALWIDGEPADALPAGDRGLAYGDGLFETMRVHAGAVPWWQAHLARLGAGAARLGIPVPAPAWFADAAAGLLARAPREAVLKLVLTRGEGGRGYAPPAAPRPTVLMSLHEAPAPLPAAITLRWCGTRLARQPALAGLKHLNRLEQVLARREWSDPGVHEGLMLDSAGEVACATAANVFALVDGRWCTPPVDQAGVAGLARAWVLGQGGALERRLSPADVEGADALFLCNAVRGILPVGRLGARTWTPHPATRALQAELGRQWPAFARED